MEQWLMGRTAFAPQWSFVALDRSGDRPQVAGFLLASRYEQDWAALGWSEGYIDQMGVLEKWRNAGVVEALIIASMRAQKDDDRIRREPDWDRLITQEHWPSTTGLVFTWWANLGCTPWTSNRLLRSRA